MLLQVLGGQWLLGRFRVPQDLEHPPALAFGGGAALLYTAALAYALEHGEAEVEAGGAHEALIGGGYALGPLAGLGVLGAVELGVLPERGAKPR